MKRERSAIFDIEHDKNVYFVLADIDSHGRIPQICLDSDNRDIEYICLSGAAAYVCNTKQMLNEIFGG